MKKIMKYNIVTLTDKDNETYFSLKWCILNPDFTWSEIAPVNSTRIKRLEDAIVKARENGAEVLYDEGL